MSSVENEIVVVLCGPTVLTKRQFNSRYLPALEDLLKRAEKGSMKIRFRVGGGEGADALLKEWLAENGFIDDTTVFDAKTATNVINVDGVVYTFPRHGTVFGTWPQRDAAMCEGADEVIGFVFNYMGAGSGTMLNYFRVYEKNIGALTPVAAQALIRGMVVDVFDRSIEELTLQTAAAIADLSTLPVEVKKCIMGDFCERVAAAVAEHDSMPLV